MNVWRIVPRRFMARWIHPLVVRFVAWGLIRKKMEGMLWIEPVRMRPEQPNGICNDPTVPYDRW